jgi:hypothetical protein
MERNLRLNKWGNKMSHIMDKMIKDLEEKAKKMDLKELVEELDIRLSPFPINAIAKMLVKELLNRVKGDEPDGF